MAPTLAYLRRLFPHPPSVGEIPDLLGEKKKEGEEGSEKRKQSPLRPGMYYYILGEEVLLIYWGRAKPRETQLQKQFECKPFLSCTNVCIFPLWVFAQSDLWPLRQGLVKI